MRRNRFTATGRDQAPLLRAFCGYAPHAHRELPAALLVLHVWRALRRAIRSATTANARAQVLATRTARRAGRRDRRQHSSGSLPPRRRHGRNAPAPVRRADAPCSGNPGMAAAVEVMLLALFYVRFAVHEIEAGRRVVFQVTGAASEDSQNPGRYWLHPVRVPGGRGAWRGQENPTLTVSSRVAWGPTSIGAKIGPKVRIGCSGASRWASKNALTSTNRAISGSEPPYGRKVTRPRLLLCRVEAPPERLQQTARTFRNRRSGSDVVTRLSELGANSGSWRGTASDDFHRSGSFKTHCGTNEFSPCPTGVKWPQVQILSARPEKYCLSFVNAGG
jgi:hypothetical protein